MKLRKLAIFLFAAMSVSVWGQTATAQTRLGLFFTQEELNIWRQRATSGPYRVAGDASTNSPGDWSRIVANKNAFASNPSAGRWTSGPTVKNSSGCVVQVWPNNNPPDYESTGWTHRMRDAAFHDRVMGVTTNTAAIKQEILWLINQSWAQFTNASLWCFGIVLDGPPGFTITPWLTRVLFAYDYVGRAAFSQAELDQVDRWFFDAADFFRRDLDVTVDSLFVNRWAGNYTPTRVCSLPAGAPYVGGPTIYQYPQYFNNRRSTMLRFSTFVGIYLTSHGRNYTNGRYGTQANLVESGKMFVREFLRYSTWPQGFSGDFERREDSLPDLGWGYASMTLSASLEIADALARTGDLSLYEYNTSVGICGSEGTINDGGSRVGQNKDLLFALQSHMKYATGLYARYHPTVTEDNRIDGRHPRNGSTWHGVHDTTLVAANLYFRDSFVKQAYTRTHSNSIAYGSAPISGAPAWMGSWAIFPATLFKFGQMEGSVWPYPVETQWVPKIPTNLTVIPQ